MTKKGTKKGAKKGTKKSSSTTSAPVVPLGLGGTRAHTEVKTLSRAQDSKGKTKKGKLMKRKHAKVGKIIDKLVKKSKEL